MGTEHAVGRAPTGAPGSAGPASPSPAAPSALPGPPSGSASLWPTRDAGRPAGRPTAGPVPSGPSPASGALPLVARRRPHLPLSVLLVALGVVAVVAAALVLGTRVGAFVLALELVVCAVARAVRPAPGPNALAVRSRALDVLTLTGFGVLLGVLALVLPGAR